MTALEQQAIQDLQKNIKNLKTALEKLLKSTARRDSTLRIGDQVEILRAGWTNGGPGIVLDMKYNPKLKLKVCVEYTWQSGGGNTYKNSYFFDEDELRKI